MFDNDTSGCSNRSAVSEISSTFETGSSLSLNMSTITENVTLDECVDFRTGERVDYQYKSDVMVLRNLSSSIYDGLYIK